MIDLRMRQSYLVQPSVHAALHAAAEARGYPVGPDLVTQEVSAIHFLGILMECGGAWDLIDGGREWNIEPIPPRPWVVGRLHRVSPAFVLPSVHQERCGVTGFGGIAAIEFRGQHFVMTEVKIPRREGVIARLVVLLGPSREAAIDVFAAIHAQGAAHRSQLRIWGGALEFSDRAPVPEEQVILPPALKSSLLTYVDRFWHLRDRAATLGIRGRRGLLLVGPPGCGKTLLVQHLLTRFPDARADLFLAERVGGPRSGNPFSDMLDSLRQSTKPAVVVLEDIDRLTDSGVVTKEFLLNALDGMLTLNGWVLWIATSNDPRGLEDNILDRPGRFDRVVVFPLPGPEERRQLIRLYSPLPIDEASVDCAERKAEGLSGAHIREACDSAVLEAMDTNGDYGRAVAREVERMQEQHGRARSYDLELGRRRAGFAV